MSERNRGWMIVALGFVLAGEAHAADNLVLVPDPPILLALIVLFVLLVAPIDRLLFKPIFRVLDERDERIAGTRARAVALEQETDQVLSRYESQVAAVREEAEQERRSLLEAARGDALGTTGGARAQAEGEIERARSEIQGALESARGSLRSQAQELAQQAAARVLGRPL